MEYGVLAEAYARAEATTKRLEMTGIVAGLLDETPLALVKPVVYLSQGKLGAEFEGIEIGVAEKLVIGAIAGVAGVKDDEVVKERNRLGDIGSAAEHLLGRKAQATLFRTPLTVETVHDKFLQIAKATGTGSQDKKLKIIRLLISEAEPLETKYLIRTVTGKLRLGIADATILDALAVLITDGEVVTVTEMDEDIRAERQQAKALLEAANDVASDLGRVAEAALAPGKEAAKRLMHSQDPEITKQALDNVRQIRLTVGTPLRAMLAERLDNAPEIIDKLGGRAALEYKYDGLRVQLHLQRDGTTRIFSRRLEDLTSQFPDIAEQIQEAFRGQEAVVEGEAVAIDPTTGRMLPFQNVSTRRGRKTGITERSEASRSSEFGVGTHEARRGAEKLTEIPIAVYLFDLLFVDGEDVKDLAYHERRARLEATFTDSDRIQFATHEIVDTPEAFEHFMQTALAKGAEGIMAKHVDGSYKAGTRGWQWIKYKADYVEGLADTLDLAIVGAFHGQGRRKGWYGAFLLAAYNPDEGRFETVCRVATGFDDTQLAEFRERLEPKARDTPPRTLYWQGHDEPDVWFDPELVIEVSGAEITISPVHSVGWGRLKADAGLAIRFPRFTDRVRDDKSPEQTTTPDEIVAMYERQVKVTGGTA